MKRRTARIQLYGEVVEFLKTKMDAPNLPKPMLDEIIDLGSEMSRRLDMQHKVADALKMKARQKRQATMAKKQRSD